MSSIAMTRTREAAMLTLFALLLLFAQSAYWLNHTIFNQQNFTSVVTPVITSEDSRKAIAGTIVDKAFEKKPIINKLIGDNVTALVTGLLGTNLAQQMTTTLVDKSYTYLTTKDPKPIAIDLTIIKTPLEKITGILASQGRDVSIDSKAIPDSITLFNPSDLPDFYGYSIFVLWLGPLCWIGALILAVGYIYAGRRQYPRKIYTLGGVIILVACIGLLFGPLLTPPIVAQVSIPGIRGIVEQLMDSLLASFTSQMTFMLVFTSVFLIIFNLRFAILRGAQWAVQTSSQAISSGKEAIKSKK